jgi:Immunity protein 42
MIVGNPSIFAIESGITHAYKRLSFRALGYFLIHIAGSSYGVRSPDASLLACSFDKVKERIGNRGRHIASFATGVSASEVAEAFCASIYWWNQEHKSFFGIPYIDFKKLVYSHRLIWAPDGDEAFDDGSFVLHFDVEDRVRLIGFIHGPNETLENLVDIWVDADEFYSILSKWQNAFAAEWMATPKQDDFE